MRIAFWVFMKLLAGVGVAMAAYGWGFYVVMSAVDPNPYVSLSGFTYMFLSVPVMGIPCIALLFKRLR
jgi:uncharacterized membrane protein YhaH (DUF805 family)